ncbi:MAG: VTT domain-containing protein [Rhodocyclales bacterium]|nr:VTT domain-containing protein [Rhodocyclales bacterium]
MRTLLRRADRPAFPAVVGAVAVAATVSMSVPFSTLLVAAVLMARRRWIAIAVWASLGAALGAALLYLVFHHLGWARLFDAYPDVVRSTAWSDATRWLSTYGVLALLVIAATPLPLTPALMFAGISRLPIVEVVLALWIGKLAKYLVYAWLASRFPERALRRGQRHADALRVIVARALSATPAQRHDATSSGELRR